MGAGKRIGELDRQTSFEMEDLLLIERDGVTKSATIEALHGIMKGEQGTPGDATIDDSTTSPDFVWSSSKTSEELNNVHNKLKYIPQDYIRSLFANAVADTAAQVLNDLLDREGLDVLVDEIQKSMSEKINTELYTPRTISYQAVGGVKEFESRQGYMSNISIEGKTLVNLGGMSTKSWDESSADAIRTRFRDDRGHTKFYEVVSNGTFTLFNFTDKSIKFPKLSVEGTWIDGYVVPPNSSVLATLSEDICIPGVDFWVRDGWSQSDMDLITESMFMVIQGDHASKDIPYFKGICSVGQGDKIDILTHSNYIDLNDKNFTLGCYLNSKGEEVTNANSCYSNTYFPINEGDIILGNKDMSIHEYDSDKTYLRERKDEKPLGGLKFSKDAKFFRFTL